MLTQIYPRSQGYFVTNEVWIRICTSLTLKPALLTALLYPNSQAPHFQLFKVKGNLYIFNAE